MSQVRKDILNGWKDIATYVGRDIRTVERWEKQRGLPIRRVPGEGRATVYAVVSELDSWFESADVDGADRSVGANGFVSIEEAMPPSSANGFAHLNAAAAEPSTSADPNIGVQQSETPAATSRWRLALVAGAVVVSVALLGWSLSRHTSSQAAVIGKVTLTNGATSGPVRYTYQVAGEPSSLPYSSQINGVDEIDLRGVYLYEQRRPETLKRAVDSFMEAIAKDPNYAPAFAGLSITYLLQREYADLPDSIAYPQARAAAERAIQLDPRLPQAHAAMGFIDFFRSADPVAAEREFHRAIELDPSLVLAHHWYGSVLTQEGRYSEATAQLNLAQRLEPTSAAVFSVRALALGMGGHRGEAVDMLQELLNEVPDVRSPHQMLAILSLVEPHDSPRWLSESRFVATMRKDKAQQEQLNVADHAYRTGGERSLWTALLKRETQLHPAPEQPTYMMGVYEALLGNNDAAFPILFANAKRHDPDSIVMNMDPRLAGLRSDPRYAKMFAETHIAEAMKVR
jgi:tetratricopeptide (TPR) repeat protein